jgi:hypothetical protein
MRAQPISSAQLAAQFDDGLIVEQYSFSAPLPADVQQFFASAGLRNVELQPEWFGLLAAHVPGLDASARLLLLRRQGRCVAAWPVQLGDEAGALRNYFTALYAPIHSPCVTSDDLVHMVRALRMASGSTGTFRFDPMDPQDPGFALLEQALQKAGLKTSRYFRFGNWHLPCAAQSWQRYLQERPGVLRSTIRRMQRRFKAAGGRVEILDSTSGLDSAIAAYERVYAASWKQQEPLHGFVEALIRDCAARGRLRFAVAWLNGVPIAAQVWIVDFTRAEIFKLAYDDAYKHFSPGTLLTAALLERVMDVDKVQEVDYLIGDDAYKSTWMTARRERWGIVAFDTSTLRGLLGAIRQSMAAWLH